MADRSWYLFDVNPRTPPALTIDPGEAVSLEVRGAFADVKDISQVPVPFTPACDGHPLAPIAGPVWVKGAEPGDAVVIELLDDHPARGGGERHPEEVRRPRRRLPGAARGGRAHPRRQ